MWIDNQILFRSHEAFATNIFLPVTPIAVVGASNDPEREVNLEYCKSHNIPVARRAGGGGAVILYPGCIVFSLGTWVQDHFNNSKYFSRINTSLINFLSALESKCAELSQDGISDIVWQGKKIAGTSIFRSRNYLLYQASILLTVDQTLIKNVLPHPSREPAYRAGKSHEKFLTGLIDAGLVTTRPEEFVVQMQKKASHFLRTELRDLLIEPEKDQLPNLYARAQKNNTIFTNE